MIDIVHGLELVLGPGTGDLSMRFGLHSGPVTAGVLRGEKSRFQLFGDTVNTAARIESTGEKSKIHLSQDTAKLLIDAGKGNWVRPRENLVTAKGKGRLQTYWVEFNPNSLSAGASQRTESEDEELDSSLASLGVGNIVKKFEKAEFFNQLSEKTKRLADYNVELLCSLLKKIVATRDAKTPPLPLSEFQSMEAKEWSAQILDQVADNIDFPTGKVEYKRDLEKVVLPQKVRSELHDYVMMIGTMYKEHPFHCFEHASHVTMSISKLLSRATDGNIGSASNDQSASFEFTSDPLTHFAVVFAALIHDVDHPGVPNAQLLKEGNEMVETYGNQSIAEQNSIDAAWELLMKPAYVDLRRCIYSTQAEYDRFRQIVINAVMATDVLDKELNLLRAKRWKNAFKSKGKISSDVVNQRATIVMEHLIQAADIAHTMQHWYVYLKWNKSLFHETNESFKAGRGESDPACDWYEGELAFFDNFVVPLAVKLQESGVFGAASEEYVNYAHANRRSWELKGRNIVEDYVTEFKKKGKRVHKPGSSNSLQTSNSSLWASMNASSRKVTADSSVSSRRFSNGSSSDMSGFY